MPLWRRKPLHERLAEEGGLTVREPGELPAPWDKAGIHGVHRPRRWDAVVAVEAPEASGDEISFVLLADGTLLVDHETPGLDAFADAFDGRVEPPYRATAVRRGGGVWAAGANRIAVVELEDEPEGDAVDITMRGGERTVLVDGQRVFGGVPALERLIEGDGVLHAERLDGKLWEVRAERL